MDILILKLIDYLLIIIFLLSATIFIIVILFIVILNLFECLRETNFCIDIARFIIIFM